MASRAISAAASAPSSCVPRASCTGGERRRRARRASVFTSALVGCPSMGTTGMCTPYARSSSSRAPASLTMRSTRSRMSTSAAAAGSAARMAS